jgi:pantothenate kinase
VAAILVAEWKPVEKVLDGDQAGAFEVRGFPRTYAFEELERGLENIRQSSMPNAQRPRLKALGILH